MNRSFPIAAYVATIGFSLLIRFGIETPIEAVRKRIKSGKRDAARRIVGTTAGL